MKVGDLVKYKEAEGGVSMYGVIYRIEDFRGYDSNYKQYWTAWLDGERSWIERNDFEVISESR